MATTFAVPDGRVAMAATLWSGTNATNNISNAVNSVSFQPNFVWIKSRNDTQYHILYDSIRGAGTTSSLLLPLTDGEGVQGALYGYLSAFASNGLTLTPGSISSVWVNATGTNYVGWQWKAGGTAVSNTAGTITSSVSANTTAGFSVVTWTGTGANATVGHGLGVIPGMMIVKCRNNILDWPVYHSSLANAATSIYLNLTQAAGSGPGLWNSTAPTASVISVGTSDYVNKVSGTYVAYCWAPVAGYSAFGSYAGNSSADGPFIYTGFRPRFILVKRTDSTSDWRIWDTSRTPYNAMSSVLYPNGSDAELTATSQDFDALSNGFKARNSSISMNASGGTYIYAAFAENPLKFSNAR